MDETKRVGWLRVLWDWIWPIAVGAGIAATFLRWVFGFALVPTSSMAPTIPNPCYVLVNHLETEFVKPYRGEVVLFKFPDNPKVLYVKRIIGMPGDTVDIRGGHVYINGKVLSEPYLNQPTLGNFGPYDVPANSYFMLGDNRSVSEDSRYWQHTYVPADYIYGRADFTVWPLGKAGPIH